MRDVKGDLVGYADELSVMPGDRIRFMVNANTPTYQATIVRLIQGDESPEGPGYKEEEIESAANGEYPGRQQPIYTGSYLRVEDVSSLALESLSVQAWIYPTTPHIGRAQGLISKWSSDGRGFALAIEENGEVALRLGAGDGTVHTVRSGAPLRASHWYFVGAAYDASTGSARLQQSLQSFWPLDGAQVEVEQRLPAGLQTRNQAPLLMAAVEWTPDGPGTGKATGLYNGKIDNPRLYNRALSGEQLQVLRLGGTPRDGLVAAWDFSKGMDTADVTDAGPNGLHGTTVQYPARAVTGHTFAGFDLDFKHAPDQYTAIHFHDDDLEDCGWESDFELTVPEGLRSGIYAARLRAADDQEDYIPFYVRPPRGTATAPIAFLAPTLTYQAYANDRLLFRDDIVGAIADNVTPDPTDHYLKEHPELGLSQYDSHSDWSGVFYSSRLRPIVSMRPKHRQYLVKGPRHFAADLYLIDWMEAKGFQYDVITDEDLHHEGKNLLELYKVVILGSHPEYWSGPMRAGLEQYLALGGRCMYLGGNGLYWVTGVDPNRPHMIEIRRGIAGIRCWESAPGEGYLSTTGEPGGLWRHRGMAPNTLVGIGFTAQGWDDHAPGYVREAGSTDPRAAWMFEGIGPEERIGEFGLLMNGAAGDELDRIDFKLGSPPHTLLVGTSAGMHSKNYLLVVEDMPLTVANVDGTNNPLVRSDLAYLEGPNGGGVFSVGSISWMGSLAPNNYDNNVSRLTGNVLRRFSS